MSVNARILARLPDGCICARLVRRVKRFSVEAEWQGKSVWAHTNNSGAMLGLMAPGAPVILSPAKGGRRKLQWTLERIQVTAASGAFWVGVNTQMPNQILYRAFEAGLLAKEYTDLKREARHGASRLDACLKACGLPALWVECKNVTLVLDGGAAFPDARSQRAQKHLRELITLKSSGQRAAMFYLVQRPDARFFRPAAEIDPEYASLFARAREAGVEMLAYAAELTPEGTALGKPLPVQAP